MCALWIDKHRPKRLEELTIQPAANALLNSICKPSFPHLLFCGPPGSGKKTRILAFIRQLKGKEISHPTVSTRTITEDGKNIDIQVTTSEAHIEITPADAGMNDRRVITNFVKETATSGIATAGSANETDNIKIIVINEAHRLSRLAQQALRRTMEKNARTCRLILVADSLSQIIEPVRSRCLVIRTPRIPADQILSVVGQIASEEQFSIEESQLQDIANESNGNLRRAINLLEMLSIQKTGSSVQNIVPEWERYTDELCDVLLKNSLTPDTIKSIRVHLYELLVHCVPPTEIFKRIVMTILSQIDKNLVESVCDAAATYEARMQLGSKPVFHLEAFCARFICIYREYLATLA